MSPVDVRRFAISEGVTVPCVEGQELSRVLSALDDFRQHVCARAPDVSAAFEVQLLTTLRELVADAAAVPRLGEIPSDLDDLQRACVHYSLLLLGRSGTEGVQGSEVDRRDAYRANLYPTFFRFRVLREVMGRNAAIPFIRDYIDARIRRLTLANPALEDVDLFWDVLHDPDFESPTSGIAGRFHRGKIAFRIDRCLLHELTEPLGDPEVSFLVCCYGDTANVEATNPNFVYTCPMTLVEGDPYCDKCLHDRRFVDAVEHPPRAFYDALDVGQ